MPTSCVHPIPALACIAIALAATASPPSTNSESSVETEARAHYKARAQLEENLKARARAAQTAAEALHGHPWAGSYYEGDGLGVNQTVTLAPGHDMVYTWHGCLGLYASAYGPIVHVDDEKIECRLDHVDDRMNSVDPIFYRIQWGERRYLVAARLMEKTCLRFNEGREVYGALLHKDDRGKLIPHVPPVVPEAYRRLILEKPVRAQATEVDTAPIPPRGEETESQHTRCTVTLDAGAADGLRLGMRLFEEGVRWGPAFTIQTIDETTCTATAAIWTKSAPPANPIAPGSRLSTRNW